jgi:hypothetical protein
MQLIGPDVDIYVRTRNLVTSHEDETKSMPFVVSFYFDPRGEPFQFDPNGAVLTMPDGAQVREERAEVKFAGYGSGLPDCQRYKPWPFQTDAPFTLRAGFCVDYFFAVFPPAPDAEYAVQIPALRRNAVQIPIPAMSFQKGTGAFRIWN